MKIGLTQRILHYNNTAYDCLEHGWYNLLNNHTFFYIPNIIEQDYKKLVSDCYIQDKPVLGVCHGAFFINELEQGVNSTIENHYDTTHKVILEDQEYEVNSYHTNQIKEVGADLNAIAHADDGSIEAFKHKNRQVWGIVWHPERMEEAVLPSDLRSLIQ